MTRMSQCKNELRNTLRTITLHPTTMSYYNLAHDTDVVLHGGSVAHPSASVMADMTEQTIRYSRRPFSFRHRESCQPQSTRSSAIGPTIYQVAQGALAESAYRCRGFPGQFSLSQTRGLGRDSRPGRSEGTGSEAGHQSVRATLLAVRVKCAKLRAPGIGPTMPPLTSNDRISLNHYKLLGGRWPKY